MKAIVLAASLMLFASASHADFIDTDWKVEDDAKATLDTSTGKEWLKFENTKGITYTELLSELGVGGEFEGWRLPTVREVKDVVLQISLHTTLNSNINTLDYRESLGYMSSWAITWREVFGLSARPADRSLSYGVVQDTSGQFLMFGNNRIHANATQYFYANWTKSSNYEDNSQFSYYLVSNGGTTKSSIDDPSINIAVRDASSPLSASIMLLAGLFFVKRKKKSANPW